MATICHPPERDGTYMICPQSTMSTQFRIPRREKRRATLQVLDLHPVSTSIFSFESSQVPYVFHQHRTLITTPVAMSQDRHQSPRIHLKQSLRFLVRIDLDILIRDAPQLQRDPYSLHKRTAIVLSVSRKFWRQWTGEGLYIVLFQNSPEATSE